MSKNFSMDFLVFRPKLDNFIQNSDFYAQFEIYRKLLKQMTAVSDEQMRNFSQDNPEFINIYQKNLTQLHEIISLHEQLDTIFCMNEQTLAKFCDKKLSDVQEHIANNLHKIAILLKQFEISSQQGKTVLKHLNDPFLDEGI